MKEKRGRMDKARPSMEVLATVVSVLKKRQPYDYVVLYSIRAWAQLVAYAVTRSHVIGGLEEVMTEAEIEKSLGRLQDRRLIAMYNKRGIITVTKKGAAEIRSMQGERSQTWQRFHNHIDKEKQAHLKRINDEKARRRNQEAKPEA